MTTPPLGYWPHANPRTNKRSMQQQHLLKTLDLKISVYNGSAVHKLCQHCSVTWLEAVAAQTFIYLNHAHSLAMEQTWESSSTLQM